MDLGSDHESLFYLGSDSVRPGREDGWRSTPESAGAKNSGVVHGDGEKLDEGGGAGLESDQDSFGSVGRSFVTINFGNRKISRKDAKAQRERQR